MKYLKSNIFAVILLISAVIFAGCESTNDPVKPDVKDVNAPTNLRATSLSDSEIEIIFDHSTSNESSFFKDYYITIEPGEIEPVSLDKNTNRYTFRNLSKEIEYTITVVARNTELKASSKIEIKWSTAYKDVNAPTNLRATSLSDSEIAIIFDHSTSKDSSFFKDYYITIAPGVFEPVILSNKTNNCIFKNLSKDTEYTITVVARNTEEKKSEKIEIKWATATRFETDVNNAPIKIYESASTYGSGLVLFDADGLKPKTLTASNKVNWNIGIDTRNSELLFGSASRISLGTGTPTNSAEIGTIFWNANSLNEVFDSEAFNEENVVFSENTYNLFESYFEDEQKRGLVFLLRVKNGTDYNYAKILIKRDSQGNLLQGPGGNRYLECVISYQTGKNLPYAK